MFSYFAHAGHAHASESATTNIPVILGAVAIFVILVVLVVIFDKKRVSRLRNKD